RPTVGARHVLVASKRRARLLVGDQPGKKTLLEQLGHDGDLVLATGNENALGDVQRVERRYADDAPVDRMVEQFGIPVEEIAKEIADRLHGENIVEFGFVHVADAAQRGTAGAADAEQ